MCDAMMMRKESGKSAVQKVGLVWVGFPVPSKRAFNWRSARKKLKKSDPWPFIYYLTTFTNHATNCSYL
jgi:hypothetical protein